MKIFPFVLTVSMLLATPFILLYRVPEQPGMSMRVAAAPGLEAPADLPAQEATALPPAAAISAPPPGAASSWILTFSDEFSGTTLDLNKWAREYGMDTYCVVAYPPPAGTSSYCNRSNNDEKEWYIDDAHQVSNGTLKLIARKNDCSGDRLPDRSYAPYTCENFPYTSGMISTRRKFSQLYGYFEARLKLPKGQGFWPAFWLLPQLPPNPIPEEYFWPPEIDILESKGDDVHTAYMTNIIAGNFPEPSSKLNNWTMAGYEQFIHATPADLSAGFHTYAVYWSPSVMIWYFDGEESARTANNLPPGTQRPPDFSGEMHIILNLATGGVFLNGETPLDQDLPAALEIDYVRVYQVRDLAGDHFTFLPAMIR